MISIPRLPKARAAGWIAGALVVLPFLQALSLDFDRCGALVLLLPALWAGRVELTQALARMRAGPVWLKFFAGWAGVAILVSVAVAVQPAAALVTVASWTILTAAGLIAGQCVANDPAAGRRMLAGLALGAAGGTLVVWILWVMSGRGTVPLYAHHRHLGLHTLAGAVACLALVVHKDVYRVGRVFWLVVGVITWGGMLWSGGRTPLLALGVAVGVWAWQSPVAVRRQLCGRAVLLLVAGMVLSAAFWTRSPELGWWHAIRRTAAAAETGSVSRLSSTRADFWQDVVHRAKDAPWLGHGPDSYRYLTPKLDGQQPHNFVLQFWLDLGLVGAVPLLLLFGGALVGGWKRAVQLGEPMTLAWLGLLTASLAAGLLDGVFYHLLALLPAMLAFGVAVGLVAKPAPPALIAHTPQVVLSVASLIILLHMSLFYMLAVGTPPGPYSLRASTVRVFPSTTFGVWRWLDSWQQTYPAETLQWTRWAQSHSPNPIFFHIYAAQMLAAQGNHAEAVQELELAKAKAHWSTRPSIDVMLRQLQTPSP